MMRFSRLGILVLLALTALIGSSCTYYNRVLARKNLVDGSQAYKERKFQEAEQLFRDAVARDPKGETMEGQIAQLFLARTLHSEYIGNRRDTAKAEEAIQEYKKALAVNKNDQASYKAIASLLENLQKNDEWLTWVTERSRNDQILPQHRAEALISLAAKKNGCANDITDTEKTKKTITKDGKPAFQFVKPENPEDLNTLRACVDEGNALIDQALALEPDQVKNARSVTPTSLSDEQLRETYDTLRVFESGRSYKASLLIQAGRLAEMEGRTADMEKFKTDSESAKERYRELSEVVKNLQAEIDARAAAAQEAANANANSNANSNAAP